MTGAGRVWIDELVAFATTIEEIALDGSGNDAMRVVRLPRPDASPSLLRGNTVADELVATLIAPAVHSQLAVWNADSRSDWRWNLVTTDREAVVSVVATSIERFASPRAGVPAPHRAFARHARAGLRVLVADAPTFELISNHWLTCCGSGVYVLELPSEWILIQVYRFC